MTESFGSMTPREAFDLGQSLLQKKICRCLNCRLDLDCAKSTDYERGVEAHKAHTKKVLESLHTGEFFEVRWSELLEKLGLAE